MQAAVSDRLPVPVLVGREVPEPQRAHCVRESVGKTESHLFTPLSTPTHLLLELVLI